MAGEFRMSTQEVLVGQRQYGHFNFDLSSEQDERARRLHAESVIINLHFQGPLSPDVWTDELVAEVEGEMAKRGDDLGFAQSFLPERALRGEFPLYRELFTQSGVTTGLAECVLKDEQS